MAIRRVRLFDLSGLVALATTVLIVLATGALVHVGRIASAEADAQAVASERALFENVLSGRFRLMARDQLSLARWDRSVANVVRKLDRRWLRDEFFDPLWSDFSFAVNVVVGADGTVLASARGESVAFPSPRPPLDGDLALLRARAVERFMSHRIAVDGGFRQTHLPSARVAELATSGFVVVDGTPALASAMAIVPEDDGDTTLADGPPVILISARPIDAEVVAELGAELGFTDLGFGPERASAATLRPVLALDGRPLGGFAWRADTPGDRIWALIVPLIAAAAVILSGVGGLLVRHIGGLSRRLEASEAHNRRIARIDALSGLANRLEIEERLAEAAARLPAAPFAWIACDLDRFKAVNDTWGHAAGDTVIREVAARLRAAVGPAGLVGRIGGDEFVVLVTAWHDRPRLAILAGEIVARVRAPIALDGGATTDVGVSLGIALADGPGLSPDAIADAADAALYRAKARGRGCAVFAHEGPDPAPVTIDAPDADLAPTERATHVA
ncbi:diguanylate cyclase domain-containing protein [Siculibacillus lacustris]|nr:diguanylate cyclase [Siculibacillus lacustris]